MAIGSIDKSAKQGISLTTTFLGQNIKKEKKIASGKKETFILLLLAKI